MRRVTFLLSAGILALLTASPWAQAQTEGRDTTPCRKVAPGPVAVPDDFSIVYRSGPTHADWGTTWTTSVNAAGLATIKQVRPIRGRGGPREEKSQQKQLSKEAVERLYATVVACDFFALNTSYWNRRVMDGSSSSLEVSAGGKKHNVVEHHFAVARLYAIVKALNETVGK
jgi:hypothetical protein